MKLYLANPIYDTVFKYLMEDERIARTILSALLKKRVVKVEQRPHEYVNTSRNSISMFRIDFAATICEDDGHEHLVLIELQKTWLETETLRFRQYLGAQYSRKENIIEDSKDKHALPMVAVYLLGHRVGNINTPVVYVNHHTYDYDGNLLESDEPNPFVESLTHNSIIVQIPLLHGHINNRLDKILSVFDQTNASKSNKQTIEVNEDEYAGDSEMEYIVRRLLSAASNPDVRQDMNVEDEFFKAIEDRDTELMVRDKAIKARDEAIKERDEAIKEREEALKEKDQTLKEREEAIKEREEALKEKNKLLTNAIEGMLSKNMDLQTIASILGMSESELSDYLHQ
ncbi:MAG: hypothetical protein PUH44_01070 [Bacteroidales bacterium]|nr:hypothetical protein [Bacteroidales bacterium]MDY2705208.1 hypothetical protein [Alloprevotella sp.]